jgi:hypothetical protein
MSRTRKAALGALTAILATAVVSVPAANADLIIPFKNFQVGGSLTVKKLEQDVNLPAGSTFNGKANLTTHRIRGDVFVPEFTSTIEVAGIPTQVTTELEQVQPVRGSLNFDSSAVHIRSTTTAILHIRKLKLGLVSVPTTCRTADPILLKMNFDAPLIYPIAFDGVTTIPKLVHCGVLGPTLTALMAGPDNPFHITLGPAPPPAP